MVSTDMVGPAPLDDIMAGGLMCAQRWFIACFVLSPFVYYFLDPHSDRRFPATISWTIRKGSAKWTQHLLWGCGWGSALEAMARSGQPLWWQAFAWQFVLTGALACAVFPVGLGPAADLRHHAAALAYMLNHVPMLAHWRVPLLYQAGFYMSLSFFIGINVVQRRIKRAAGLPSHGPGTSSGELRQMLEERKKRDMKRLKGAHSEAAEEYEDGYVAPWVVTMLWWLELAEQLLENALFMFFVFGMNRGAKA
uniref:Uncharacterized protein n=1 Tax=Pyramimonas obovata TaxID=1411642 RepID=A0A7S0WTN5_9CHLO|mmetsp:Transcript_39540/g.86127  ORF Transcript_39540/g.86127 Transcript_39540/m.86127 type:complete len:251 (+) Transcript_39540:471-1223(+)|eukprot:CAMPEP_0118953098 /NCGR_PEP_ID=MMETSP1169-20130426/55959_1 /TAXON_ID=36882 /ORGANISM="Pyramimonas obovata, Strain CCMP722" /LENGTH=250 /DNA_ID=CAMNT_0006900469 /DNA_START=372 /DNA_END=1124 /DNA_ORIENTATION=-